MEFGIISLTALLASALTLFSGFGLGTLLMPVVAIFFPLDVAIAITAMVHLSNNLFKVALLGRHANTTILLTFGGPAVVAALAGSLILGLLSEMNPILGYSLFSHHLEIIPVKLIVGLLILGFLALELSPRFSTIALDRRFLPLGGLISGFFGGLSGHQGAFRSMFLLKTGLSKQEFVATAVMLAVMVDVSRMLIYGLDLRHHPDLSWPLVTAASLSAFTGAYLGSRMLKKMTIASLQTIISFLLAGIATGLISGML